MIYTIPYIALFIFYGFASLYTYSATDEKIKHRISILCIVVYVFFFGFRGFIWDDWISYYPAFQDCSFSNLSFLPTAENPFEIGFSLMMVVCKSIINDYSFFVLLCTVVNITLLIRFFSRRISNIPLGLILFLCFDGLVWINLLRNAIAILIFINSLEFIEKRKPLPYFSLCLLAVTFHFSALLYIPLYFFLNKNCNKWVYLAIILLGNFIYLAHIQLLLPIVSAISGGLSDAVLMKIDSYSDYKVGGGFTISIGYLERLFTSFIIFCYFNKLKEIRKENIVFINCIILYFSFFFAFSEIEVVSKRLSGLFVFAYWIIWYDLIKCFYYRNNRWLFVVFMGIYCLFKIIGSTNNPTAEYENILFGASPYQEKLYLHNKVAPDK